MLAWRSAKASSPSQRFVIRTKFPFRTAKTCFGVGIVETDREGNIIERVR